MAPGSGSCPPVSLNCSVPAVPTPSFLSAHLSLLVRLDLPPIFHFVAFKAPPPPLFTLLFWPWACRHFQPCVPCPRSYLSSSVHHIKYGWQYTSAPTLLFVPPYEGLAKGSSVDIEGPLQAIMGTARRRKWSTHHESRNLRRIWVYLGRSQCFCEFWGLLAMQHTVWILNNATFIQVYYFTVTIN